MTDRHVDQVASNIATAANELLQQHLTHRIDLSSVLDGTSPPPGPPEPPTDSAAS